MDVHPNIMQTCFRQSCDLLLSGTYRRVMLKLLGPKGVPMFYYQTIVSAHKIRFGPCNSLAMSFTATVAACVCDGSEPPLE